MPQTTYPIHVATIHLAESAEVPVYRERPQDDHSVRVSPGAYRVELRESRGCGRPCRYLAALFHGADTRGQPETAVLQPYKYQLRSGTYWGGRVEIVDDAAIDLAAGV